MRIVKTLKFFLISFTTIFITNQAFSAENMGAAHPWGLNLREAFSPVMAEMVSFHNVLIWLIAELLNLVQGISRTKRRKYKRESSDSCA